MASGVRRGSLAYEPPFRHLTSEAFYALCCVGVPAVAVFLVIGAPWRYVTAAVSAALAVWAIRRVSRIRLVVNEQEVTVRNYWKTYVIPWGDVTAIAMTAKAKLFAFPFASQPSIGFWRRNGHLVKAQATPIRESDTQSFQHAVMAFAPPHVRALTPPPDWWAEQDEARQRPSD
jgi:hypothetical protein